MRAAAAALNRIVREASDVNTKDVNGRLCSDWSIMASSLIGCRWTGEEELQGEGGVRQITEYCKELVMRGREELSFEELRAERYFTKRQRDMEDRLKLLQQEKQQLSLELQEKRRLWELYTSHQMLSPIGETSMDSANCSSPPGDQEGVEPASSAGPVGGAAGPCDPEVRWQLLDLCDVTSCPRLLCKSQPLPDMGSCLQLGGEVYLIYSRVMDGGSFSVYSGASEEDNVIIKVDSCRVPWDFYQLNRLKKSLSTSTAVCLPKVSCFLFLNGCITVYTTPPDHMFMALPDLKDMSCHKAFLLLQLVLQLHSCGVVHAGLQPSILSCSYHELNFDGLFPVDWSSSVDLDLQQDVTSVQQLAASQVYITLGLLDPTAPPQLVDLVGLAETMHLLLTGSRMVLVKDGDCWMTETFSGDKSCDMSPRMWMMWRRFFHSLLNVDGRSSLSVLSELKQLMSTL